MKRPTSNDGPIGMGRKSPQASQSRAGRQPARRAGETARFWAKVDRNHPSGCRVWTGALTKNGYGRFRVWRDGQWTHVMAHRWAYEDAHGPIPNGIYPDHTCHTNDPDCPGGPCIHRRCVDEAHLDPVDDEENRRRARARRRP